MLQFVNRTNIIGYDIVNEALADQQSGVPGEFVYK